MLQWLWCFLLFFHEVNCDSPVCFNHVLFDEPLGRGLGMRFRVDETGLVSVHGVKRRGPADVLGVSSGSRVFDIGGTSIEGLQVQDINELVLKLRRESEGRLSVGIESECSEPESVLVTGVRKVQDDSTDKIHDEEIVTHQVVDEVKDEGETAHEMKDEGEKFSERREDEYSENAPEEDLLGRILHDKNQKEIEGSRLGENAARGEGDPLYENPTLESVPLEVDLLDDSSSSAPFENVFNEVVEDEDIEIKHDIEDFFNMENETEGNLEPEEIQGTLNGDTDIKDDYAQVHISSDEDTSDSNLVPVGSSTKITLPKEDDVAANMLEAPVEDERRLRRNIREVESPEIFRQQHPETEVKINLETPMQVAAADSTVPDILQVGNTNDGDEGESLVTESSEESEDDANSEMDSRVIELNEEGDDGTIYEMDSHQTELFEESEDYEIDLPPSEPNEDSKKNKIDSHVTESNEESEDDRENEMDSHLTESNKESEDNKSNEVDSHLTESNEDTKNNEIDSHLTEPTETSEDTKNNEIDWHLTESNKESEDTKNNEMDSHLTEPTETSENIESNEVDSPLTESNKESGDTIINMMDSHLAEPTEIYEDIENNEMNSPLTELIEERDLKTQDVFVDDTLLPSFRIADAPIVSNLWPSLDLHSPLAMFQVHIRKCPHHSIGLRVTLDRNSFVKVAYLKNPSWIDTGVRKGDILLSIGTNRIRSLESLKKNLDTELHELDLIFGRELSFQEVNVAYSLNASKHAIQSAMRNDDITSRDVLIGMNMVMISDKEHAEFRLKESVEDILVLHFFREPFKQLYLKLGQGNCDDPGVQPGIQEEKDAMKQSEVLKVDIHNTEEKLGNDPHLDDDACVKEVELNHDEDLQVFEIKPKTDSRKHGFTGASASFQAQNPGSLPKEKIPDLDIETLRNVEEMNSPDSFMLVESKIKSMDTFGAVQNVHASELNIEVESSPFILESGDTAQLEAYSPARISEGAFELAIRKCKDDSFGLRAVIDDEEDVVVKEFLSDKWLASGVQPFDKIYVVNDVLVDSLESLKNGLEQSQTRTTIMFARVLSQHAAVAPLLKFKVAIPAIVLRLEVEWQPSRLGLCLKTRNIYLAQLGFVDGDCLESLESKVVRSALEFSKAISGIEASSLVDAVFTRGSLSYEFTSNLNLESELNCGEVYQEKGEKVKVVVETIQDVCLEEEVEHPENIDPDETYSFGIDEVTMGKELHSGELEEERNATGANIIDEIDANIEDEIDAKIVVENIGDYEIGVNIEDGIETNLRDEIDVKIDNDEVDSNIEDNIESKIEVEIDGNIEIDANIDDGIGAKIEDEMDMKRENNEIDSNIEEEIESKIKVEKDANIEINSKIEDGIDSKIEDGIDSNIDDIDSKMEVDIDANIDDDGIDSDTEDEIAAKDEMDSNIENGINTNIGDGMDVNLEDGMPIEEQSKGAFAKNSETLDIDANNLKDLQSIVKLVCTTLLEDPSFHALVGNAVEKAIKRVKKP